MKTIFAVISCLLLHSAINAQTSMPSYPEVLHYYFSRHTPGDDYEHYINFAKRKDGWYVQHMNQLTNEVSSEAPLWLKKDAGFSDTATLQNISDQEINQRMSDYLSAGYAYDWYNYERSPYYGYNGWDLDMINDFANKDSLSDTLLDGLTRAYAFYSARYSWYQYGGIPLTDDPLQKKLGALEYPSTERINKSNYYIQKSIETAKRIRAADPDYVTRVGNADLQVFNEQMYGYNFMIMALQNDLAKEFITNTKLDSVYIIQAKNYLNSCPLNAILFTYGDNDTYPLWFVQKKENYRKDITVINNSLLGLAIYPQMLKQNNTVRFTTDSTSYGKSSFDVSVFSAEKGINENTPVPASRLLRVIRDKKYSDSTAYGAYPLYPYRAFYFDRPVDTSKLNTSHRTAYPIFYLTNELLRNDYLMLDIVNENIASRPICFTVPNPGHFDSSLERHGIIYQLNNNKRMHNKDRLEKELENFVLTTYRTPLINFNGKRIISFDGNNTFFPLYADIADYYLAKADTTTGSYWLNKDLTEAAAITEENIPSALILAEPLMRAGNFTKAKEIFEIYANFLYNKYVHPSALNGFLSKSECINQLNNIEGALENDSVEDAVIKKMIGELSDGN
jgi:hypothetical protein